MTQPALFVDLLVVHAVLPNMATACGRTVLEVCDEPGRPAGSRAITFGSDGATCPACLEQPIRAMCQDQQRRQAAVA